MNLHEDIKSITELKIRPAALIESMNRRHRPLVITQNGRASAVVQDVASYEATRNALLLLKMTAQGEADIRRGRSLNQSDVVARMDKRLGKHA